MQDQQSEVKPEVSMFRRSGMQHRSSALICLLLTALSVTAQETIQITQPVTPDTPEHWVIRSTVMVRSEQGGSTAGWGSGFFINNSGLMITNNHVIDPMHGRSQEERARLFRATTKWDYKIIIDSGTTAELILEADVLHQTESGDMALLQLRKIDGKYPKTPHYLTLSPDGAISNRMYARIVGFPGGEQRSKRVAVTSGKVTDLLRSRNGVINYVETDAEAHAGNSGGSVTNRSGEVIGILTRKRFEEREKDRSGAVPAHLIKQFLMIAFSEERVPQDIDVLPFAEFFLDQNGILELPRFTRDQTDLRIYFGKNRVRKAELLTEEVELNTRLGKFKIPLNHAAYLFINGKEGDLLLEGGDRMKFQTQGVEFKIKLDGKQRTIPLEKIDVVCFPRALSLVPALEGDGVILNGDGTRLGLAAIDGQLRINNATFTLDQLESISPLPKRGQLLTTTDEQKLQGRFDKKPIAGRTTWSPAGIDLHLSNVRQARFRQIDWTYYYSRGRLLTDRLAPERDELITAMTLLDSPDWSKAKPILEKVKKEQESDRFSPREERSQRHLGEGVLLIRAGEYQQALDRFGKLSNDAYVGPIAQAYSRVIEEYPDGQYNGESISNPDVLWRASTAVARRALTEMKAKMLDLPGIGEMRRDEHTMESGEMRRLFRDLDEIEDELDIIDRLEIGIAQGRIVHVLELAVWSRVALMRQLYRDWHEQRDEFRSSRTRTDQNNIRGKLRRIRKQWEKAYRDYEKLLKRLREDSVGFSLEMPDLEED